MGYECRKLVHCRWIRRQARSIQELTKGLNRPCGRHVSGKRAAHRSPDLLEHQYVNNGMNIGSLLLGKT
eukprot:9101818-Pyramimonas_sp.AAC.1